MRIEPFEYLRPVTLKEACEVLSRHPGVVRILAGGTDLIPRLKQQLTCPAFVVDMTDVQEYRDLRREAAGLVIGAGVTLHTIVASEVIRKDAPVLSEAAGRVASQQIRNVATLGGNLCLETRCWYYNQSLAWKRAKPSCFKAGGDICHVVNKTGECYAAFQGDTAPVLLTLDAQVKLISLRGERTIALAELYSGKSEAPLTIAPDEIVAEVLIPRLPAGSGAAYLKFSHRRAVDFPLASVAIWLSTDGASGRNRGARLALSGVSSAPFRVPKAEEILTKGVIDAEVVAKAAEAAVKAARPVNNLHHGPPALRRKMVGILSKLAIEEALGKATGK